MIILRYNFYLDWWELIESTTYKVIMYRLTEIEANEEIRKFSTKETTGEH